ncbi:MAG: hypothetical protein LCH54_15615 [Bacteroidetes bacterium]|nr:hypothetical protein [Bacteroidota bacterium]
MTIKILTSNHIEIGEKHPFRLGVNHDGTWLTGKGHQIWKHKFTGELFITSKEPDGEFSEEFIFICHVPEHAHNNLLD